MNFLPINNQTTSKELQVFQKPLLYRPGNPFNYIFDAGQGKVFAGPKELNNVVADSKDSLSIIPIGVDFVEGQLFGIEDKDKWICFYFLNASGMVCSIYFHGYSVERFSKIMDLVYYLKTPLLGSVLKISIEKETNKEGKEFYIASFMIEEATHRDAVLTIAHETSIFNEGLLRNRSAIITNSLGTDVPPALKAPEYKESTKEQA